MGLTTSGAIIVLGVFGISAELGPSCPKPDTMTERKSFQDNSIRLDCRPHSFFVLEYSAQNVKLFDCSTRPGCDYIADKEIEADGTKCRLSMLRINNTIPTGPNGPWIYCVDKVSGKKSNRVNYDVSFADVLPEYQFVAACAPCDNSNLAPDCDCTCTTSASPDEASVPLSSSLNPIGEGSSVPSPSDSSVLQGHNSDQCIDKDFWCVPGYVGGLMIGAFVLLSLLVLGLIWALLRCPRPMIRNFLVESFRRQGPRTQNVELTTNGVSGSPGHPTAAELKIFNPNATDGGSSGDTE